MNKLLTFTKNFNTDAQMLIQQKKKNTLIYVEMLYTTSLGTLDHTPSVYPNANPIVCVNHRLVFQNIVVSEYTCIAVP